VRGSLRDAFISMMRVRPRWWLGVRFPCATAPWRLAVRDASSCLGDGPTPSIENRRDTQAS